MRYSPILSPALRTSSIIDVSVTLAEDSADHGAPATRAPCEGPRSSSGSSVCRSTAVLLPRAAPAREAGDRIPEVDQVRMNNRGCSDSVDGRVAHSVVEFGSIMR